MDLSPSAMNSRVTKLFDTSELYYELMLVHAKQRGTNAVIAMRYDTNEQPDGVTEVLAYGTTVVIEAIK
jgi:uncharacterized protein YbjQ (UPF0145 family)